MELILKTKDGTYTLNELVGEGSFGYIYSGIDPVGKSVALKIVPL